MIVSFWLFCSVLWISGCQTQDVADVEGKKNLTVENTPRHDELELEGLDNGNIKLPTPDSKGEPRPPESESANPVLQDQEKPDPVTASQTKDVKRRPTKPTDASALADRPEKPKFLPSEKVADPSEVLDLTFDDLAFEMKEDEDFSWSMITPEIHRYDGARIKLRGFIKPSFHKEDIKQFVFVRDNQECCFGPGAALYDCVLVKMAPGAETNYTVRPITLEGTLYLRKYAGPDGNVWAIFRMKDGQVK